MKLLEPFTIKGVTLRNRIVMPAMDTNMGDEDGVIYEELMDYYETRAKGECGLIIVEAAYFTKRGSGTETMLNISDDDRVDDFAELVARITAHGSQAMLQIYHAGCQASEFMTGHTPEAPSDVPFELSGEIPEPLTKERIAELVDGYAQASRRAQEAGFVGVEIHAGHGYLLNQFLSKINNKRDDEYGPQSLENRMRMHLEVLHAVRDICGDDFIIGFRLNGSDYREGGVEVEEVALVARRLEDEGADLIHITGGTFDSPRFPTVPYMNYPRGCFVTAAAVVKEALDHIPVIVVGRINDPAFAEQVLVDGKADLIAMGRGLLADPELPKKLREGRPETIRLCIGCNTCLNRILTEDEVDCAINANIVGGEEIEPADEAKKVLVVGAGPAGLEAARVAACRGHEVLLIDKRARIGGALVLAAAAPMKVEMSNYLAYHEQMLADHDVQVRLNTEFTPELLAEFAPDALILATGTVPLVPPIPGLDAQPHYVYDEILGGGEVPAGQNVAIIGGGMVGMEVAEFLSHRGKKVTIVEMLKKLGDNIYALVRKEVVPLMEEDENLTIHLQTKVEEVLPGRLRALTDAGAELFIDFDDLVMATGAKPHCDADEEALQAQVPLVVKIGDCKKKTARKMYEAVHEGYNAAMKI